MTQTQPTKLATDHVPTPKAPSKTPWHRPTVTFVPLQGTAFFLGSPTDGSATGSVPTSL